jgi:phenylacetate-CoA ligase
MGMGAEDLSLRSGLFGAEPWSDGMREQIEAQLGLRAYDIYGLSEVIGPGVSAECTAQSGLHVFDDHFIPEIVDPATGDPMPDGEDGELVFTCVSKRCLPLLRYRTGDISRLHRELCPCGRTHARMTRITGRTDDMLIIRGINVFPSQIEDVLMRVAGVAPHYRIIVSREGHRDALEVEVELAPEMFSDTIRGLESLEARIVEELRATLSLTAKVRLVEPHTVERSMGKAKRVIDKRQGE